MPLRYRRAQNSDYLLKLADFVGEYRPDPHADYIDVEGGPATGSSSTSGNAGGKAGTSNSMFNRAKAHMAKHPKRYGAGAAGLAAAAMGGYALNRNRDKVAAERTADDIRLEGNRNAMLGAALGGLGGGVTMNEASKLMAHQTGLPIRPGRGAIATSGLVGAGFGALYGKKLTNLVRGKGVDEEPDSYVTSKARKAGIVGAGIGAGLGVLGGLASPGPKAVTIPYNALNQAAGTSLLGGGLGALYGVATKPSKTKEASFEEDNLMSLYDYANMYKAAAEAEAEEVAALPAGRSKARKAYDSVKDSIGRGYAATKGHLGRNKGRYAAGAAGVAGVGAAVAAYNRYQNKEASYDDFYDEYEEVQLAKLAAEELYQDALEKLAFAEDLYEEADFVCKVAEDLGAGVDVVPREAFTGYPLSGALHGAGIGMGTMAGAAAGAALAGKLGPKLNPAFYAAHPGLATGAGILGAGIGAAAPGALTAFVEKHRQNRAQQQVASMAMQNQ